MNGPIFDSFLQRFLNQTILDTGFIYIDFWSLVHFGSGLILGLLLTWRYQGKLTWLLALATLAAYEVTELFLNGIFFVPETPLDTAWDFIIGMLGFFVSYLYKAKTAIRR